MTSSRGSRLIRDWRNGLVLLVFAVLPYKGIDYLSDWALRQADGSGGHIVAFGILALSLYYGLLVGAVPVVLYRLARRAVLSEKQELIPRS
jgi:hypothetical protein